jgi:type IV pilus assembly protein PilE
MRISNRAGRLSVAGFTLLEMMIAVAVAGILAAIAIPVYSDYVTRSKIVGATSRMGDVRTQMEKFFSDNRSYLNGGACGAAATIATYNADPASNFTMTCPGPTATTYTIQVDGIAARGMGGFTYTVDQANAKQTVAVPAGWAGGGLNCWVLKKDGSC